MTLTARLSASEAERRAELETLVKRGLANFVEVGTALHEIKSGKLYRSTHKTFEAYCIQTFGIGVSHGKRLVEAAKTAHNLAPVGAIESERSLRPLANLSPVTQRAVYAAALEAGNGKATEAKVQEALDRVVAAALEDLPEEDQQVVLERKQKSDLAKASVKRDAADRDKCLSKFTSYITKAKKEATYLAKFHLGKANPMFRAMVKAADAALRAVQLAKDAV